MGEATLSGVRSGGGSGRALLGWIERDRLHTEVVHRFANRPVRTADGLHWDILALWAELQQGLALAAQRCGNSLVSVGVDTWGSDFALLDKQGTLLSNPWHYRDRRTDTMQEAVERVVPRAEIYAQTGNQSMRQNTLLQLMALAEDGSPLLEVADTLLMIPDLFHYWLSGECYVEFSGATTTQFYNPRARALGDGAARAAGHPHPVPATDCSGRQPAGDGHALGPGTLRLRSDRRRGARHA